jgi:hypothetical protein
MTEAEWLACEDPIELLRPIWTSARGSERHLRLFAVACCRRSSAWFPTPEYHGALVTAEQYADGLVCENDLIAERKAFPQERDLRVAAESITTLPNLAAAAYHAARAVGEALAGNPHHDAYCFRIDQVAFRVARATAHAAETRDGESTEDTLTFVYYQIWKSLGVLVREVFGNPFRPPTFSQEWRTDTALALARQMYESRDFGAMPILADALQDAGCASEGLLAHCRGPGPHVRGCWVVDLVLGKQ